MKQIKQLLCLTLAVLMLTALVLPGHALGQTLSGTVTSFGDAQGEVTLVLIPQGSEESAYEQTVVGTGYSFTAVAKGAYTLVVSKEDHVTRAYDVTVGGSPVEQDVKLCFPGDVSGDGTYDIADAGRIYSHVRMTNMITDSYQLLVADIVRDDSVDVADTGKVYNLVVNGVTAPPKAVTISVWTPDYDWEDRNSWLIQMEKAFQKEYPQYKITWENGSYHEGDAGYQVAQDPAAAADVYMFANDQLGTLVPAGGITALKGKYEDQVLADNSQTMINTVTYTDGRIYGFPVANNTWFMYYNKEVFTGEDIKSLDTMLEKGKVAFPWSTAWYGGTFFLANGGTLFGEQSNDAADGIRFGQDNGGYEAALKMVQLCNHPNMVEDTNGLGASGLTEGSVDAFFSGSWEYSHLSLAMGDKLGAAQLPTVEIGGEQKQMKAFAGAKVIGVNPYADEPELAMAFAAFLANPESQKLRFEKSGAIPAAAELAQDGDIKNNIVAAAEINTITNTAVVQPFIPEMASYWTPVGNFGARLVGGEITEDNYMEHVDQLMEELNTDWDTPDDPFIPDVPEGDIIPDGNDPDGVPLKVWAGSMDQYRSDSWLIAMEEAFMAANPEYRINWINEICNEADAGSIVSADPVGAADVYLFVNDQVGTLVEVGALTKLEGAYLDQVLADNSQAMVNTVTYTDDGVYGFPVTGNTWFMYYNKDVFTEEDVKSLDTMLEKGKVAFSWDSGWYNGTFFLAAGGTLFGENGNDASAGIQFGEANNGYEAALKMIELAANPNFVEGDYGQGFEAMKTGEVGAFFSGSWDYSSLFEYLGDSLGAAQLPAVEIGGQQKQMKSFLGSRAVGVNAYSAQQELALEFAAFLASQESQKVRYEDQGVIPAASALEDDPAIKEDLLAVAQMDTAANTSVVQPCISEMAYYWTPMGNFGMGIVSKQITVDNYQQAVDLLMTELNPNVGGEDDEPDIEIPEEDPSQYPITLRIHYHRPDGDYEDWELWCWDPEGISLIDPPYALVEEDGEMIATIPVKAGTREVGYLVRLGEWEDKDIYEDQFIDITGVLSGTVDVYIESGVEGHTVVYDADVITGYTIVSARYNAVRGELAVRMSQPITDYTVDTDTFTVTGDQGTIAVSKVIPVSSTYYLTLEEELAPGTYTVSFEGLSMYFSV